MDNQKRIEIDAESLEQVNGGSIGFNPDGNGTYTMKCKFTGETHYGVTLAQIMQIAQFASTVTDTLEGEQQILDWAHTKGII